MSLECGSRAGQRPPRKFGISRIQRLRALPIQLPLRARDVVTQDEPLMATAALTTDTPQSSRQYGYLPQDPRVYPQTVERFVVTHYGLRSVYLTLLLSLVLIGVTDVLILSHRVFYYQQPIVCLSVVCVTCVSSRISRLRRTVPAGLTIAMEGYGWTRCISV